MLTEPLGAQAHLRRRLLSRDVEDPMSGAAQVAERHPRQRALADPRRAAEQDQRPGHEPATEHAIELGDAGQQPVYSRRLDVAQRHRPRRRARYGRSGAAATSGPRLAPHRLDKGVPLAAPRTAPGPGKRHVAALLADEMRVAARHGALRLRTPPDAT